MNFKKLKWFHIAGFVLAVVLVIGGGIGWRRWGEEQEVARELVKQGFDGQEVGKYQEESNARPSEKDIDQIISAEAPELDVSDIDINTSGWKIYRNEKYGYEFKLPKDYVHIGTGARLQELPFDFNSDGHEFISKEELYSTDSNQNTYINIFALNSVLEDFLAKAFADSPDSLIKKAYINNGIDFYKQLKIVDSTCPSRYIASFNDVILVLGMVDCISETNLKFIESIQFDEM